MYSSRDDLTGLPDNELGLSQDLGEDGDRDRELDRMGEAEGEIYRNFFDTSVVTRSVIPTQGVEAESAFNINRIPVSGAHCGNSHKLSADPFSFDKSQIQQPSKSTSWGPEPPLPLSSRFDSMALSTSNFSSEPLQPRPLKTCPDYFMKHTSFISQSSHADVLKDLSNVLASTLLVDHEYIAGKNKIRGIVRSESGARSRFCIKAYSFPGSAEIMIEFHRREGCSIIFSNLYRSTVAQLPQHFVRRATSPKGSTEKFVCNAAPMSFDPLPLSSDDEEGEDEEADKSLLDLCSQLCKDATCEYLDIQREAMGELVGITHSKKDEDRLVLDMEEAVSMLEKSLTSGDEVVQELACMLLVNISKHEPLRCDIVKRLLSTLFVILDAPGSVENRASKRCVAHAFEILSSCPRAVVLMKELVQAESARHMTTLKKYSQYNDSALKQHINMTVQQIEAA